MRKQDKDLNVKPEALLWLDFETTGTDRDAVCRWRSAWNAPTCWANIRMDPCIASSDRTISTCWT